jgi:hypothetical protein
MDSRVLFFITVPPKIIIYGGKPPPCPPPIKLERRSAELMLYLLHNRIISQNQKFVKG